MVPALSPQTMLMVGIGAVAASIFEAVFDGDMFICVTAHVLGAVLALLFAYQQFAHLPLHGQWIIRYLTQRPALVFVSASVVVATIVEGGLRPGLLRRFVAHYFGLFVAAVLMA
jgi:hypothetical protein